MIKIKKIANAKNNWIKASQLFKFKIELPYHIFIEGDVLEVFAYLPELGSRNGMILDLICPPDFKIEHRANDWAKENGMLCSYINLESYQDFDSNEFIDCLTDWKIESIDGD